MCSWCSKPLLVRMALVAPPLRVASSPICKSACSKAITLSVWLSWNKKRLSRVALPVISADERFPTDFLPASHSRRSFPIFETISHNHPQCGLSRQKLALLFDSILLFFSWSICKTCPSLFFCTIFSTIRETIALNRGRTFPSSPTQRTSAAWTSKLHFELVSHTWFYIFWWNNPSNYCQTCETRAQ